MADPFQPQHLLKFRGDPELEFCYRAVVQNRNKHNESVQAGLGCCSACNSELTADARPRLKPPQKFTRTIQKLISRTENKLPVSKSGKSKLKKFFNSSQHMIVRCLECQFVNRLPILSREELVKLKQVKLSKVEDTEKDSIETPAPPEASKKKKKKKKKKKGERIRSNPNSLLYDDEIKKEEEEEEEEEEEDADASSSSTKNSVSMKQHHTVSLSQFVQSQTKDNSPMAVFQKAIGVPQTPATTLIQPAVGRVTKTSTYTSAPGSRHRVGMNRPLVMHKQLKKFLADRPPEPQATSSLKDFLSLL